MESKTYEDDPYAAADNIEILSRKLNGLFSGTKKKQLQEL